MARHCEIHTLGAYVAKSMTDERKNNVVLARPYRGEVMYIACLVKFRPVV